MPNRSAWSGLYDPGAVRAISTALHGPDGEVLLTITGGVHVESPGDRQGSRYSMPLQEGDWRIRLDAAPVAPPEYAELSLSAPYRGRTHSSLQTEARFVNGLYVITRGWIGDYLGQYHDVAYKPALPSGTPALPES